MRPARDPTIPVIVATVFTGLFLLGASPANGMPDTGDDDARYIVPGSAERPAADLLIPTDFTGLPFASVDVRIAFDKYLLTLTTTDTGPSEKPSFAICHAGQAPPDAGECRVLGNESLLICLSDGAGGISSNAVSIAGVDAWRSWFLQGDKAERLAALWVRTSARDDEKLPTESGPAQADTQQMEPPSPDGPPQAPDVSKYPYAPLIPALPMADVPWGFGLISGTICLVVLLVFGWFLLPVRAYIYYAPLALFSVLSRFAAPLFFVHSKSWLLQQLVWTRHGQHDGAFFGLLHISMQLFGDHFGALLLPGRALGALLPVLAFLLAFKLYGRRAIALIAAAIVLLSPVTTGQAGSLVQEQLATPVFYLALLLAVYAVPKGLPLQFAASVAIAFMLALGVALKKDYMILPPLYVAFMATYCHYGVERRRVRWRAFAIVGLWGAVAAMLILLFSGNLDTLVGAFLRKVANKGGDTVSYWYLKLPIWFLATVLILPPFLPQKLAFVKSLKDPQVPRARAYQLIVIVCLLIYSNALSPVGVNFWRYALMLYVPMAIISAPYIREWIARPRNHRWALALLAFYLVFGWVQYAGIRLGPIAEVFKSVSTFDPPPDSLVIAFNHRQDQADWPYVAIIGKSPVYPVEKLWPAQCPVSTSIEFAQNLLVDRFNTSKYSNIAITDNDSTARPPAADLVACREQLELQRRHLSRFKHIFLLADHSIEPLEYRLNYQNRLMPWGDAWELIRDHVHLATGGSPDRIGLYPIQRIDGGMSGEKALWSSP